MAYQRLLSPDHSWLRTRYPHGFCKFYPTCSEYARQAITEKGIIQGAAISLLRIIRCNPWSKGGIDVINPKHETRIRQLADETVTKIKIQNNKCLEL